MKVILIFSILFGLQAQALTNAHPAESEAYSAVVFIRTDAVEKDGSDAPSFCNATFLSNRLLITAAHCLVQAIALKKTEVTVDLGEYLYSKKTGARIGYATREKVADKKAIFKVLPSVEERLKRKGVNTDLGLTDDLALIYLSSPITFGLPIFTTVKKANRSQASTFLARMKESLPEIVTVNPITEVSTLDSRRSALLNNLTASGRGADVKLESKSTARVEPGDSGAPLFMRDQNRLHLIGITKGRGETFFSNWDVYTWIGDKACEIGAGLPLTNDEKSTLCQ